MLGAFGDRGVDIKIDVEQPGRPRLPGDSVGVTIELAAAKPTRVRGVRAGLVLWQNYQLVEMHVATDGPAEQWRTDETWLERATLVEEGTIPAGFRETYRFDWRIPEDAAPSCEGSILRTRYVVVVNLDRPMARDIDQELELRVVVPPPAAHAEAGEGGEASHPEIAAMTFALPKLAIAEGEALSGRLVVEPHQDFEVRGIRLDLLRIELLTFEDAENGRETVELSLPLASRVTLRGGSRTEYEFSLPIPATGAPTYRRGDSEVKWALQACLDRAWTNDPTVRQEICIYSPAATA
jgi:hypothetical protein